mgnify:FL=1|tara:strand:- start:344 stop:595 length:252 start_codon:yes stop_codon:yes gene_type:complete
MKEYKLTKKAQDIVPAKNLEEVINKILIIETRREKARELYKKADFRVQLLEAKISRLEQIILDKFGIDLSSLNETQYKGDKNG